MMRAGHDPQTLYGKPWSEREHIVVLAAYFAHKGEPRHVGSQFIVELARVLDRTPASINMRMENFASLDQAVDQRIGLLNVGNLCRSVFDDWSEKRQGLADCADVLRRDALGGSLQLGLFEQQQVKIPRAFGRYELLDELGEGGFGRVYSCMDTATGELRAIKIIPAHRLRGTGVVQRFSREIRALRAVQHPNVIQLLEDNLDSESDYPAFVMAMASRSLTRACAEQSSTEDMYTTASRPVLSPDVAVSVIGAMCDALEALHAKGIIHRDLNPNNILQLPDMQWVLADFGLAKFLEPRTVSTAFSTRTNVALGTAFYAAPEQYRDLKSCDVRTDIHALGMLVWELFTVEWGPPRRERSGLPESLVEVFIHATAHDPNERTATVTAFRERFDLAIEELTSPRGQA